MSRIDSFVLAPSDSIASSLMMFTSQNKGAGRRDRINEGLWKAMAVNASYTAIISALIFVFSKRIISLFVNAAETAIILEGSACVRTFCVVYILSAFCNIFQGFFRGIGRMDVALYATFLQIPIRVAASFVLVKYIGLNSVAAATGLGWVFMGTYHLFEYKKLQKSA